jgi:drug/metabolite transporter (DMT)-like permease
MPLTALALVLMAAFAHASWNLLAKGATGGAVFVWLTTLAAVAALAPLAAGALLTGSAAVSAAGAAFMAGSGALHSAYFVAVQRGYRVGDLSLVYPVARGTGPLLATLGAVAVLGERPRLVVAVGIALICLAVLSLAGRPRRADRAAIGYALLTGVLIALYTVWDKHAVDGLGQSPVVYLCGNYVVMLVLLAPAVLRHRGLLGPTWRDHRRAVVGVGLLGPLAYLLVLVALASTDVAFVAPAREVSIVVATALGVRLLGEGDRRRRIAASAVIVAGVVALALG